MFLDKLEFRFPKKVSFWEKLKLKELCRSINLNAHGYHDIIALSNKVGEEYNLQVSISFYGNTTTFSFESI